MWGGALLASRHRRWSVVRLELVDISSRRDGRSSISASRKGDLLQEDVQRQWPHLRDCTRRRTTSDRMQSHRHAAATTLFVAEFNPACAARTSAMMRSFGSSGKSHGFSNTTTKFVSAEDAHSACSVVAETTDSAEAPAEMNGWLGDGSQERSCASRIGAGAAFTKSLQRARRDLRCRRKAARCDGASVVARREKDIYTPRSRSRMRRRTASRLHQGTGDRMRRPLRVAIPMRGAGGNDRLQNRNFNKVEEGSTRPHIGTSRGGGSGAPQRRRPFGNRSFTRLGGRSGGYAPSSTTTSSHARRGRRFLFWT